MLNRYKKKKEKLNRVDKVFKKHTRLMKNMKVGKISNWIIIAKELCARKATP